MVALSLADRLSLENIPGSDEVKLSCDEARLATGEDNLVVRAVRALEAHCGRRFGLRLHLQKNIPLESGLGGGSSDAAAALKGVNQLLELGLGAAELSELAKGIGSDVPFFIHDSPCDCSGRGELVTPVDGGQDLPVLLLKPPFGVSAAWAYRRWADSMKLPGVAYAPQICPWGEMVNDLERPVFEKFFVLARLKVWLLDQAEVHAALLSGSGSTLVVVLVEADGGEGLAARAKERFGSTLWTHLGSTLGSSKHSER